MRRNTVRSPYAPSEREQKEFINQMRRDEEYEARVEAEQTARIEELKGPLAQRKKFENETARTRAMLEARAADNYRLQARAEHLAETNARNISRGFVPRNRTLHRRQNEGESGPDCCVMMMVVLVLTVSVVGSVGRLLLGGGYITNDLKVLLNAVNIDYPESKSDTDILNDLTMRIVNICKNPSTFTDSPELTNSIENILNTYKNNVIYPQLLTLSNKLNDIIKNKSNNNKNNKSKKNNKRNKNNKNNK